MHVFIFLRLAVCLCVSKHCRKFALFMLMKPNHTHPPTAKSPLRGRLSQCVWLYWSGEWWVACMGVGLWQVSYLLPADMFMMPMPLIINCTSQMKIQTGKSTIRRAATNQQPRKRKVIAMRSLPQRKVVMTTSYSQVGECHCPQIMIEFVAHTYTWRKKIYENKQSLRSWIMPVQNFYYIACSFFLFRK